MIASVGHSVWMVVKPLLGVLLAVGVLRAIVYLLKARRG